MKYIAVFLMLIFGFSGLCYELDFRKSYSDITSINSGIVNAPRLNVRSGPSTMYPRIEVLYIGDQVNINRAASESWLEITLEPIKGYIHSDFFEPAGTEEVLTFDFDTSEVFTDYSQDTDETFGLVTGNSVNVRSRPEESAGRLAIVNEKVRLRILGRTDEWYYVSFLSKRTGYVYARYVSKERRASILMDFTPVLRKPDKNTLIRHIPAGMQVYVLDRRDVFFRVYIPEYDLTGWVPQESVTE